MDDRCKSLREALDQSRGGRRHWRCPQGLRREVVSYTLERRSGGDGVARIAEELGLSEGALSRWLRSGGGFREVRIRKESSASAGLVLVTPRGYRLEGLSEALACRLLREL